MNRVVVWLTILECRISLHLGDALPNASRLPQCSSTLRERADASNEDVRPGAY